MNKDKEHFNSVVDDIKKLYDLIKGDISNCEKSDFPRNRIIFGAPGTGKSYKLNKDKDNLLNDGDTFERVTFHPDYSYANFVGCYKPIMKDAVFDSLTENQSEVLRILQDKSINAQDKYLEIKKIFTDGATRIPILIGLCSDDNFSATNTDDEECSASVNRNHGIALRNYVQLKSKTLNKNEISYEYIPGPFIRVLVNALKDKDHKHLLIIEEINRANVAAVFGDVFQLLDRSSSGGSEYGIQISEDLKKYLSDNGLGDIQELKIPNNMYIWATMNSADQGVFPMDTAFKRRWNFEYMSINEGEEKINTSTIRIANKDVNWNSLRKSINNYLSKKCINEDKLMGPFFLSSSEEITMDILKYKVLMYLHEDVVKHRNIGLFKSEFDMGVFSSICKNFEEHGIEIFNNEILETVEYSDMVSANHHLYMNKKDIMFKNYKRFYFVMIIMSLKK